MAEGDDVRAEQRERPTDSAAAQLLRIACGRDRDAFAQLFQDYAPRVKTYLLRLGAREEIAEDLAQETFARVWRRASTYDPGQATAAAWIFAIARNLRIDALRRERHPSSLDGDASALPDDPQTPAEHYESAERRRRLSRALECLPAEQLAVLRLSFFLGHTHAQIADELRLPLGTVKSRLRLAMTRVRSLLDDL